MHFNSVILQKDEIERLCQLETLIPIGVLASLKFFPPKASRLIVFNIIKHTLSSSLKQNSISKFLLIRSVNYPGIVFSLNIFFFFLYFICIFNRAQLFTVTIPFVDNIPSMALCVYGSACSWNYKALWSSRLQYVGHGSFRTEK